jgi:drug/metabolite transporter (DMT)-like permease
MMGGMRFLIAGGIMLAILLAMKIPLPKRGDIFGIAAPGFLMLSISNGMIGWAEIYVASNIVSVLVLLSPFSLVGFSRLLGEPIPRSTWNGLAVSFAGVIILFWKDLHALFTGSGASHLSDPNGPAAWITIGAVLLAATVWSGGSVLAARHKVETHVGMRIAWQMLFGGVGQLVLAALLGEFNDMHAPSMRSIYATLYLIVVGSWIGYGSYIYVLRKFRPDTISIVTYVNTIVAVLVGWRLGGEPLTREITIGAGVILAGIVVVNRGLRAARGAPATPGKTE